MIQKLNVSTYEHQSGTETSGKIHWLLSLKGMLIKKVLGECYQHSPGRYDALASPLSRGYATCFKPSPGASRTGAFVLSTAGTKPGASDKGASAAPRAQGVSCG